MTRGLALDLSRESIHSVFEWISLCAEATFLPLCIQSFRQATKSCWLLTVCRLRTLNGQIKGANDRFLIHLTESGPFELEEGERAGQMPNLCVFVCGSELYVTCISDMSEEERERTWHEMLSFFLSLFAYYFFLRSPIDR